MTTVAVTGSSGGVGTATCRELRARGLRVVGLDRNPPTDLDTVDEHLPVDLGERTEVDAVGVVLAGCHDLVGLVHNAAHQHVGDLLGTERADWDTVLEVNLTTAHVLTRACEQRLRANSGAVVCVSSVHALASTSAMSAYATSKAALVGWVRAVAVELAPDVRVNAVLPGAVDTPMLRAGLARFGSEEEPLQRLLARTPAGRLGRPAEIAQAIAFLLDAEAAGFITGASLVIDGGVSARLSSE